MDPGLVHLGSGAVHRVHIIAKDTIDEDVMKALQKKEKTQNALIDAVRANLTGKT